MTGGASGTSGAGGQDTASGAGGADVGDSESRCAQRPQVFASEGAFNCVYACLEGFADCDDSRDNGCETDLSAPGACDSCGLAFSCLAPEMCGQSETTCSNGTTEVLTISLESRAFLELGGFAADDGGRHVMTVQGAAFDTSDKPIDLSGGVAFRHENGDLGTHAWTSLPGTGGTPPSVERFGDRLIFFGTGDDAVVLASTDVDGVQRWSARLPMSGYATPRDVILDPEGNLYLWVAISSGNLTVGEQVYEYNSLNDFNLLVSFSPDGAVRWVSSVDLPDELWTNAIHEWKSLVIWNDRVSVLRRGELATFSRADGSYQGAFELQNMFGVFAQGHAFIKTDAAGDFYIASVSRAFAMANEAPMPNAVPAGDPEAELPERFHAHITKLDHTTNSIVWRRTFLWNDDPYEERLVPDTDETSMHIRSFAVAPDGFSWVLAAAWMDGALWQVLVGVSSDGHIDVARYIDPSQTALFVGAAADGAPYIAGTYEDFQVAETLFDGMGVFVEKDLFDALLR